MQCGEKFTADSLMLWGFSMGDIVTSDQTHTTKCACGHGNRQGKWNHKNRGLYTDVDGMITNVPGLVLATFYADCVPLFFFCGSGT